MKPWVFLMACGLLLLVVDTVPRIMKAVHKRNTTDPGLEKEKHRFGVKFNSAECEAPHDQAAAAVATKRADRIAVRRRKAASAQALPKCPHCLKPMAPAGACAKGQCVKAPKPSEVPIRRVR